MIPKTTTALFVFLAFVFFAFTIANAESLLVNLAEELQGASIITPAKIVSYDTDALKFQPLGSTDILSAGYSTDPTWNPSRFIHVEWPPKDEKVGLTAEWPPVGAEVLIVIDKENVISIFAWSFGEKYRFWSPMMTGSVAGFNCKSFGNPIELISKDDPDTSLDGCLVDKSRITSKGISPGGAPSVELTEKSSKIVLSLVAIVAIVTIYFIIRRQRKIKSN
ncbi:MAG: hypothetical protein Q8Q94_02930 [bacterium]|nr:hypothetical protein [bacterium]